MNITNQKPAALSPIYQASAAGQFAPIESMKDCVVKPLFNPLAPGTPVQISTKSGALTEDEIVAHVAAACDDHVNVMEETWCRNLFSKTLLNYDSSASLSIQDLFAAQSGATAGLPAPGPNVMYTPTSDVIPAAKKFLAGQTGFDEFFASLAYFARPQTLGFYFASETFFMDFKNWLAAKAAANASKYPAETNQMLQDFIQNIRLPGLTESLLLRNTIADNIQENSFARVIIEMLMEYATTMTNPVEFGVLPFCTSELFCPISIVFVNVDQHAKSSAAQITTEWDTIKQALNNKINMISNNKLTSLTAIQRNLKKIQGAAVQAAQQSGMVTGRSARLKFRKTPPSRTDAARYIMRLLKTMAQVNRSENSYKQVKITYQKPNRRDPDDFNKPGKSVSVQYKPDIHVYIDTSGSISEENYQSAIKDCIKIAKKLNINLYFNSFSHVLSQCTKLNVKDKPVGGIYKEFQKIPKVSGGTDYEQIWHYINMSKKRRRELSLIITDFEWTPRNQFIQHPKNLYYMPCAGIDWPWCVRSANQFAQSMLRNEPAIRKHILM